MIKILNRWTLAVIFESEKLTMKEVLSRAVLRGAVLSGADLRGADLRGAVLSDATVFPDGRTFRAHLAISASEVKS